MSDHDLQTILDGLGGGVAFDLLDRDGPALLPATNGGCWYCQEARHGQRGSSCPVVFVPLPALLRPTLPRWLRRERGLRT